MNKRRYIVVLPVFFLIPGVIVFVCGRRDTGVQDGVKGSDTAYRYPEFYRGFYIHSESGNSRERLKGLITMAKKAGLNAVVIDVQTPGMKPSVTSREHVEYCIRMGFHPIARVVVFPEGLKSYPAPKELLENRLAVAEAACRAGFREIQFDYIRFNDHGVAGRVSLSERYEYIAGFIDAARRRLSKYEVKLAADIFGRIPLNADDTIGQKMEVFDRVVDIICPMAYPSHYTWSDRMMADPYYTVHLTSKRAKERASKAEIVTWIQAFRMKVKRSGLAYEKYIEEQIRAVHDAGVKGYLLWNASQDYDAPFAVCEDFYRRGARFTRIGAVDQREN
ncbi:MAG: hypothetical protein E4G96_01615 [Chrysiogenales bacterium]|nr:MAG: hypothetical protein E4G96_01615 [Chrysiogenales bacterium]